jgi:hypothetical protein
MIPDRSQDFLRGATFYYGEFDAIVACPDTAARDFGRGLRSAKQQQGMTSRAAVSSGSCDARNAAKVEPLVYIAVTKCPDNFKVLELSGMIRVFGSGRLRSDQSSISSGYRFALLESQCDG